jgi:hypothetical protein
MRRPLALIVPVVTAVVGYLVLRHFTVPAHPGAYLGGIALLGIGCLGIVCVIGGSTRDSRRQPARVIGEREDRAAIRRAWHRWMQ